MAGSVCALAAVIVTRSLRSEGDGLAAPQGLVVGFLIGSVGIFLLALSEVI